MTELKSILNMRELTARYLFANTPYYLYKHFKSENTIEDLSQKYSSEKLISLLDSILKEEIEEIEDAVIIYAILISLTYKPYHDVKDFFKEIRSEQFEWFNEIATKYLSESIDTKYEDSDVKMSQQKIVENKAGDKSSSNITVEEYSPIINEIDGS